MKTRIALALLTILIAVSASAGSLDNDASCDIKVGPAATLLLPYFEVDLQTAGAQTTASEKARGSWLRTSRRRFDGSW